MQRNCPNLKSDEPAAQSAALASLAGTGASETGHEFAFVAGAVEDVSIPVAEKTELVL